jgi:hypothetical protein
MPLSCLKCCVLDLGSYVSMPAPNERDTLKLKENYANDIVKEEVCGLKRTMLSPSPRLKKTAHHHCTLFMLAMTLQTGFW